MSEKLKRGMEFGIVGLGQAGGNISNDFAKEEYRTIVINTSSTDLDKLDSVSKSNQLLINSEFQEAGKSLQGAGKNPEIGRAALENRIEDVLSLINRTFYNEVSKVFVVAGLGGGSGTGMIDLTCEILIEQGYDVGAIITLPSKFESSRVHMVALQAFERLSQIDGISTIFIVDNQKASEILPMSIGFQSKYKTINKNVVRLIDSVNKASVRPSETAFDARDLDTILSARGGAVINEIMIENIEDLKNDITLSSLLKNSLTKGIFVNTDFSNAQGAAFLFELPKGGSAYLNEKSLSKMIEELGVPFDVSIGVYESENKDEKKMGTLTVIITGLPFPEERLLEIEKDLNSKEENYTKKFEKSRTQTFKSKNGDFMSKFNYEKTKSTKKDGPSTLEKLMAKKRGIKNTKME